MVFGSLSLSIGSSLPSDSLSPTKFLKSDKVSMAVVGPILMMASWDPVTM